MSSEPEKLAEGTLISHLLELRDRLLRALIAVAIAFVPCVLNANALFTFLSRPLAGEAPAGRQSHRHRRHVPVHHAL